MTAPFLGLVAALIAALAPVDAEALYRAGKYAEALAAYEAAIRARPEPGAALLYNAGNCAFRLNQFPKAALYYHRAALRAPSDPRVRFNLLLTQQKLGMPPETETFVGALVRAAREARPATLLAWAVGLEAAGLATWVGLRRRRRARAAALLLLTAAVGTAALFVHRAYGEVPLRALVLASEVKLYSEPREDLPFTVKLKVGELVEVAESSDRWVRVRYGDRTGWTPREGVGLIE